MRFKVCACCWYCVGNITVPKLKICLAKCLTCVTCDSKVAINVRQTATTHSKHSWRFKRLSLVRNDLEILEPYVINMCRIAMALVVKCKNKQDVVSVHDKLAAAMSTAVSPIACLSTAARPCGSNFATSKPRGCGMHWHSVC